MLDAMQRDPGLAGGLRSHLASDSAIALPIIGRAVARGELPAGADAELAGLVHEVIEAHLFRRMAIGGALDDEFARHVVDDLVIPVLITPREGKP